MSGVVKPQTHVFDWFREEIERARARTGVPLSDDAGLYLAQMLSDRVRADRKAPEEATLAEMHGRAAHAAPGVQARMYRELGDRSLTLLGLFRAHVERKAVGPAYYADMGSAAYARADEVFKRWFGDAFGEVFAELARHFQGCVEVLGQVRADRDEAPLDLQKLAARLALSDEPDPRIAALLLTKPGMA